MFSWIYSWDIYISILYSSFILICITVYVYRLMYSYRAFVGRLLCTSTCILFVGEFYPASLLTGFHQYSPTMLSSLVTLGSSQPETPPGWPSSHFRSPSQNRSGTVPPAKHWLGYDACSFDHPLCFFSNWHAELPENLERCANYPIVRVCQTEVLFLKKEIMLITANPLFSQMKIEQRNQQLCLKMVSRPEKRMV